MALVYHAPREPFRLEFFRKSVQLRTADLAFALQRDRPRLSDFSGSRLDHRLRSRVAATSTLAGR
jgi:hypothetical protein